MPYRSETPLNLTRNCKFSGTFPCSVCGKVFCHSSSLSRHRMQAHFKSYTCTQCNQEISSEFYFLLHFKALISSLLVILYSEEYGQVVKLHEEWNDKWLMSIFEERWRTACNVKTTLLLSLTITGCSGNETLRSHMFRIHSISRMFMCRCCNWAYPDKTSLHIHMQSMLRNGTPGDVSVLARSSNDGPGMAGGWFFF
ncbi:unnamed protein product [Brugia timori]|uniref:C2H2-type domain-containing protein n=1 Tax=Brugia timori TaxID=42155 RepID=A0A0R3QWV0_9BILA|nr:unnamed protein product [Brugia timori]